MLKYFVLPFIIVSVYGCSTAPITSDDSAQAPAGSAQPVAIAPPQAAIGKIPSPNSVGGALILSAAGSFAPNGGPLFYTWLLDGIAIWHLPTGTYQLLDPGVYELTLRVVDPLGLEGTARTTITYVGPKSGIWEGTSSRGMHVRFTTGLGLVAGVVFDYAAAGIVSGTGTPCERTGSATPLGISTIVMFDDIEPLFRITDDRRPFTSSFFKGRFTKDGADPLLVNASGELYISLGEYGGGGCLYAFYDDSWTAKWVSAK